MFRCPRKDALRTLSRIADALWEALSFIAIYTFDEKLTFAVKYVAATIGMNQNTIGKFHCLVSVRNLNEVYL